jgi:hypothetical protein
MAKITQVSDAHHVTPSDQEGLPEKERVVYRLRTPTVLDRMKVRRLTVEMGGRPITEITLASSLRHGIRTIPDLDDTKRAAWLIIVDEFDDAAKTLVAARQSLIGITNVEAIARMTEQQGIVELERVFNAAFDANEEVAAAVSDAYEPYRAHLAARDYGEEVEILAAFILLVTGATNLDGLKPSGDMGLSLDQLSRISDDHLAEVGARGLRLLQPSAGEAKN